MSIFILVLATSLLSISVIRFRMTAWLTVFVFLVALTLNDIQQLVATLHTTHYTLHTAALQLH